MGVLTSSQQNRVDYFICDEWVDPDDNELRTEENLAKLLERVESAEELDAMVKGFNWDAGLNGLHEVLQHPLTDPGTRLRAFWASGPGYFQGYASESEISEYQLARWKDVLVLQQLALDARDEPCAIAFDPTCDEFGYDWTHEYEKESRRLKSRGETPFYSIPSDLCLPSNRRANR